MVLIPSFSHHSLHHQSFGFPIIPGLWTTTTSPSTTPLWSRPTTRRSTRARRGSWCWTRWRGSRGRWWCGPAMVGMWGMGWGWWKAIYYIYFILLYHIVWGGWRSISHLLFTRDQRLWLVEMWIRDVVCCLLELLGCGWILSHIPSLQWSLISFSTM